MSREKLVKLEKELNNKGLLDEPLVKQLLADYKEKTKTKYGLVWEEHPEQVHEELETGITNVTEYIDKRIIKDKSKPQNLLIEGDNLHGLMLLKDEGVKVDVIYIDPPYNTGNEFVYNDKIVDSEDGYKHSKWLSFMSKRLELAYDLLSEDGVIFVSIDDNEQANLKLLMDKIFGEKNFISNIPRLTSPQRPSQEAYISNQHDYLLIYSKNKLGNTFNKTIVRKHSKEVLNDDIGSYVKGDTSPILASKTQGYSKGGDYDFEYNGKTYKPLASDGTRRRWLWSRERMDEAIMLGILVPTATGIRVQNYLDMEFQTGTNKMAPKSDKLIMASYDLMDVPYVNKKGSGMLVNIGVDFDFPKPIELISELLKLHLNNEGVILDFFAGSGTTAQAVMELNEEDGGNRQFILMTNNEVEDCKVLNLAKNDNTTSQLLLDNDISLKPHKGSGSKVKNEQRDKNIEEFFHFGDGKEFFNSDIVQDEGICRKVTYERIRRVIEGDYANPKKNDIIKPLPNNLSYYKLDVEQDFDFEDEYRYRMRQSLLGLIAKEGRSPIQIDEYTFVFDRGENEALVYDAGLYTKQSVLDDIIEQFEDYNFEVISENNNADIKWKNLRKGVI